MRSCVCTILSRQPPLTARSNENWIQGASSNHIESFLVSSNVLKRRIASVRRIICTLIILEFELVVIIRGFCSNCDARPWKSGPNWDTFLDNWQARYLSISTLGYSARIPPPQRTYEQPQLRPTKRGPPVSCVSSTQGSLLHYIAVIHHSSFVSISILWS